MRDLFIEKRYGLYGSLMERLQFAILRGPGRAPGAIMGAGRSVGHVLGWHVPGMRPPRGEAEKGRAPPAKSTVIFASLFRGAFEICFQDAYILPACSEMILGMVYDASWMML
jgi:hypothetical protein